MDTKYEVNISVVEHRLIGAYNMNDIIKRLDDDADKRSLVDLWTTAHQMKQELRTLRGLIAALPQGNNLPY
jgi:hypothetical protein